jgi:colicin import membrane protein
MSVEKRPHTPVKAGAHDSGRLFTTGVVSLVLHMTLILFLGASLRLSSPHPGSSTYRVTLRPFSPPGDGLPKGGSGPAVSVPAAATPDTTPPKSKSANLKKGAEVVEREKTSKKKKTEKESPPVIKKEPAQQVVREERVAGLKPPKTEEKVTTEKIPGQSLQEAIENIRKKAALDEIQKKVAQRSRPEKGSGEPTGTSITPQPLPSSKPTGPRSGSSIATGPGGGAGAGTGVGTGTGVGAGTGTGSGTGSGFGSGTGGSILEEYTGVVWAKIKRCWSLPENLPKGKVDLEAIIVILIEKEGKVQKAYFEKRSGNTLYDQMAMRAIKKADPLPPIPEGFGESLEIGLRFYPE